MFETLIHERVVSANKGKNETAIIRLMSGWVVLGDNQTIPGYCLLLGDPVTETVNDLIPSQRAQFLIDMTIVGDALLTVVNAKIINYSLLQNVERALHAHIHPRYDWEKPEYRTKPPNFYAFKNEPRVEFDSKRDEELILNIRNEIKRIYHNYDGCRLP